MQKTLKGLESLNKAKKFHLIAEGNDPKEFANPFQRLTGKIMKSKFPDAYYCRKYDVNSQNLYYIEKDQQTLKVPKSSSFMSDVKKSKTGSVSPTPSMRIGKILMTSSPGYENDIITLRVNNNLIEMTKNNVKLLRELDQKYMDKKFNFACVDGKRIMEEYILNPNGLMGKNNKGLQNVRIKQRMKQLNLHNKRIQDLNK